MDLFESLQMMYESHIKDELIKDKRDAKNILSNFTSKQIDYIKSGYDEYVKEIGDAYVDERESYASQIKNELLADCIENDIVNNEEFEDIWNALEKLGKIKAHANA